MGYTRILKVNLAISLTFITIAGLAQSNFNTVRKKVNPLMVSISKNVVNQTASNQSNNTDTLNAMKGYKLMPQLMALPLDTIEVTSNYGPRIDPFTGKRKMHWGIDLRANKDSVKSLMPGIVKKTGHDKRLGQFITINHGHFKSTYGHLSTIIVKKGEKVNAGNVIGVTGSTGRSTSEHLHLTLKLRSRAVDPLYYLRLIEQPR